MYFEIMISLMESDAMSSKGKHIDVNCSYVHYIVEIGEGKVDYYPLRK